MTMFCTTPPVPLVTTNDFNSGSLRLKYLGSNKAVEEFSISRQARTLQPSGIADERKRGEKESRKRDRPTTLGKECQPILYALCFTVGAFLSWRSCVTRQIVPPYALFSLVLCALQDFFSHCCTLEPMAFHVLPSLEGRPSRHPVRAVRMNLDCRSARERVSCSSLIGQPRVGCSLFNDILPDHGDHNIYLQSEGERLRRGLEVLASTESILWFLGHFSIN